MDDPDLERIRQQRLAQLQAQHGGTGDQNQAKAQEERMQAMEEAKQSILAQALSQDARARWVDRGVDGKTFDDKRDKRNTRLPVAIYYNNVHYNNMSGRTCAAKIGYVSPIKYINEALSS